MIDLLELVARTFALLGSGSGGSVVIPALIVVGLIGAATAAVVLVAALSPFTRSRTFACWSRTATRMRRVMPALERPDGRS
jgi:uncharacterized membrane protein